MEHEAPGASDTGQVLLCTAMPLPPGMVAATFCAGTGDAGSADTTTVTVLFVGKLKLVGVAMLIAAVACAANALQIASTFTRHEAPTANPSPAAHAGGPPLPGGGRGSGGLVEKQSLKSGGSIAAICKSLPDAFRKSTGSKPCSIPPATMGVTVIGSASPAGCVNWASICAHRDWLFEMPPTIITAARNHGSRCFRRPPRKIHTAEPARAAAVATRANQLPTGTPTTPTAADVIVCALAKPPTKERATALRDRSAVCCDRANGPSNRHVGRFMQILPRRFDSNVAQLPFSSTRAWSTNS